MRTSSFGTMETNQYADFLNSLIRIMTHMSVSLYVQLVTVAAEKRIPVMFIEKIFTASTFRFCFDTFLVEYPLQVTVVQCTVFE